MQTTNRRRSWGYWLNRVVVVGLGVLLGQLGHYLWRLWQQPRLAAREVWLELLPDSVIEAEAVAIAKTNVRQGLEKRPLLNGEEKLILCAGTRNFREPWARDFGFACYGLLAMGEIAAVKEGLSVFLHYQKPSGQFPVKVHSTNLVNRAIHSWFQREQPITAPLRPKYRTGHHTISLDGNALLATAVLNYVEQQDDIEFLQAWWPNLEQAMNWLAAYESSDHHLLHQEAFADWADSIGRRGYILYTNVLYWKATEAMARAAARLGHPAAAYQAKAAQLKQQINAHFWDEELGYFITSQQFHNLSSDGNLMAISWGLTTEEQAHAILDAMDRFQMADPVPTQVVNQPYPAHYISLENRLAGIPEYHISAAWLWLGAWHVVALTRMGRREAANTLLRRLSELIVRDGIVHEVYGKDGHFLSTLLYTSEAPLTWNASMVVYAYSVLQEDQLAS